jgi:hypothetical protein
MIKRLCERNIPWSDEILQPVVQIDSNSYTILQDILNDPGMFNL